MKTAIIYSSTKRLSKDQQCVYRGKSILYMRFTVVNCHYSDGLDHVKPRKGETFFNCVPLDEQKTA